MRRLAACLIASLLLAVAAAAPAHADTVRLKDIGKFAGWRDNALVGYGLVTGLAGTGDSAGNKATRQSIANVLAQFDVAVLPDDIQSRNAAAVMITAKLPAVAREGDTIDVTVTSIGDARSLAGGNLLISPLKGPNGKVYALAQGALFVGGYKFDQNGSVAQKNHPTTGAIPGGATVEVAVRANILSADNSMTFTLADADYTTASRIAGAINGAFGQSLAKAVDAAGIEIAVPEHARANLVEFITRIERLGVEPDNRARVVVDERTGTVVSGGDVRIARVVISHGDLKLSIVTDNSVSQPLLVRQTGPDVRTETVANSRIRVSERDETGYVSASNNSVADLIQALTRIKTSTRDIISILRAVKAAGALHADLVIQ
ncbi:flagellar basal body P-ring protein FlgI [Massilia atriviolacea]|uniref:Flagellar P-ring protein n=1 Tax=Massilia atriviolacea TaxID=2495579 RepID=A0A430HFJ5_9BURK|nr:flagellar basal body P-ring protein FlgI [Massilia atriviolacea]RSZ56283.1 flagellar basal body P-ring protein FlgI [Massilia atriviolacea]